jgi:hypothetical protein
MIHFPSIIFDYRILLFAMPFFMLARQAGKLRIRPDHSAPWLFLIWFGLGYALTECLALCVEEPAGSTVLGLVRAAIMAPALFALLEFGRRQVRIAGKLLPGWRINPPLILLALAGVLLSWDGLAASCLLALGIPGGLMSGLALWQLSKTRAGQQRFGLRAAAVSLWATVPVMVLTMPLALVEPAFSARGIEFLASAQFISQAVLAICALGAWTGLGIYRSQLDAADGRSAPLPLGSICSAIVLSIVIGIAALDRSDAGSQTQSSDEVIAVIATQDASNSQSRVNQEWEQIVSERRHKGLNFLKGATIVVVCLVGAYYCLSIGWSAMSPRKQCDTSMSLHEL